MQGPLQPRHTVGISSSTLSKDRKNFVFFSNETKGAFGRAVKIDVSLFPAFLALVDPATYSGGQVVRAIVNLRSTARQMGSQANAFNAFEYLMTAGNVAIRYRVSSEGENDKGTVYITRVSSNFSSNGKSGFYSVAGLRGTVKVDPYEGQKFSSSAIYLNGTSGSGDSGLRETAELATSRCQQSSCLMMYSNGDVVNDLGVWKPTASASRERKQMVSRVREALELNAGEKKQWVAEGEGAALLLEAVTQATGNSRQDLNYEKHQFSNYQFKVINPVGDTSKLLGLLRQKKANISEQALTYDNPGRAATVSALAQYGQMTQRLGTLGTRPEFNQAVTKRFKQAIGSKVANYKAGSGSGGTFYEAVARTSKALK